MNQNRKFSASYWQTDKELFSLLSRVVFVGGKGGIFASLLITSPVLVGR